MPVQRPSAALAVAILLGLGGCFALQSERQMPTGSAGAGGSPPATAPGNSSAGLGLADPEMLPPGTLPAGRGLVELRVNWPEGASGAGTGSAPFRAQLLPESARRVDFAVAAAGTPVASASVLRSAGASSATASLELDAGSYDLAASAFAGLESGATRVATASAALRVIAGAKVPVGMTLVPSFVPQVSTVSATTIHPGGSLTFGGSSLAPAWAATPSVVFTGAGASASATVTGLSAGSITVTVPETARTGAVQITTDGVPAAPVTVTIGMGIAASWELAYQPTRVFLDGNQLYYMTTQDGDGHGTYRHDIGTGQEASVSGHGASPLLWIDGGVAFLGCQYGDPDTTFLAVDKITGSQIWSVSPHRWTFNAGVGSGSIYLPTGPAWSSVVRKISMADGSVVWNSGQIGRYADDVVVDRFRDRVFTSAPIFARHLRRKPWG
ncbi:MAG: hypothetical protein FJZ01_26080 [Candidatus Sericytochromatia bacterium]|nr:hypothetical protein [Candidatus Tanganyikabacteria bacterium]